MAPSKINILISTAIILMCIAAIVDAHTNDNNDDYEKCQYCTEEQNETTCRYFPDKKHYPNKKCAKNPKCSTDKRFCLPILGKHPPVSANISLCKIPGLNIAEGVLNKLETSDIILTIRWNHLKCKGRPTTIFIKLHKCVLYLKLGNLHTTVNCIILFVCRILPLKKLLLLGEKSSEAENSASCTEEKSHHKPIKKISSASVSSKGER